MESYNGQQRKKNNERNGFNSLNSFNEHHEWVKQYLRSICPFSGTRKMLYSEPLRGMFNRGEKRKLYNYSCGEQMGNLGRKRFSLPLSHSRPSSPIALTTSLPRPYFALGQFILKPERRQANWSDLHFQVSIVSSECMAKLNDYII